MTLEQLLEEYPYLYETHLHTSQGSRCGLKTGAQMARACKEYGYTGIFVSDHNWGGNTRVDRSLPWETWVEEFSQGYRDAKAEGDKIDLDVFWAWESGYDGTEFLLYGLSPEFMKEHPELHDADPKQQKEIIHSGGGIVVQAHPFREADYIPCTRLFFRDVDALEGINATHTSPASTGNRSKVYDPLAIHMAQTHGFSITAGSDVHDTIMLGGGMRFKRRLKSAQEFVEIMKGEEDYIVTDSVSYYDRHGNLLYAGEYPENA